MESAKIKKLGGVSVIAGAVILALWTVLWSFLLPISERGKDYSLLIGNGNWVWIAVLSFVGIIFMIFGFTAVYSVICEKTGFIGLLGYITIIIAYIFQSAKVTWEIFIYPFLISNEQSLFLIKDSVLFKSPNVIQFRLIAEIFILVAVVLFCISLFKSKMFSKKTSILIFIGAIMYGVGPMINIYIAIIGVVIFATGCIMLGKRVIAIS